MYSSIFLQVLSISLEYSIKALESVKCKCFNPVLSCLLVKNSYFVSDRYLVYELVLSISGWELITLNNEFVYSDPEPSITNILYRWSGICG